MSHHLLKFQYSVGESAGHTTYVVLDQEQMAMFTHRSFPITYNVNEEDTDRDNCRFVEALPLDVDDTTRKCLNNRKLYNIIVRCLRKQEAWHVLIYYQKQCDYRDKKGYLKYQVHEERVRILLSSHDYRNFCDDGGRTMAIPCAKVCSEHPGESVWLYRGHRYLVGEEVDSVKPDFNRDIALFFLPNFGITLTPPPPAKPAFDEVEDPDNIESGSSSSSEEDESNSSDEVIRVDAKVFDEDKQWLQELTHSFLFKNENTSAGPYAFGKVEDGNIIPLTPEDIEIAQGMGLDTRELANELV
jgi:hypothetical protein